MRWYKVLLAVNISAVLVGCGNGTQQNVEGVVEALQNEPSVSVANPTFPTGVTFREAGVHDPSVIGMNDSTFYSFGSHMAYASSTDIVNRTQLNPGAASNDAAANTPLFNTYRSEVSEGIDWVGGNLY